MLGPITLGSGAKVGSNAVVVRDVALRLNADARIGRYRVDVENFESIHNHSAYARIERV